MLAIKNNIMAGNAARHLGKAYDSLATSVERLASGLRINSAKDDAAGLAVRELIRADVAVLQQGARNAQDGISMLQTMEGAMAVMDDNLIRMKELAEQAATGSYSDAQRTIMNAEFAEMADEIDRIAGATKFNDIAMLNTGTGTVSIHVGTASTIDVDKVDMTKNGLGIETGTGNWAVMTSDDGAYDGATSVALTIDAGATNDFVMKIAFAGEQEIDVDFGGAAAATTYTLQAVADAINAVSNNPSTMYDADGTSFGYSAASIVETSDGKYKLQIEARSSTADSVEITATNAQTAGAVTGIFGSAGAVYTAAGDMMTAGGDLFQKWDDTLTDWVDDIDGGAGAGLNILTATAAAEALDTITSAISTKDTARASFGYKMNRLESTIAILDIQAENLMSAESRISDVDVATEMAALTRTQVLSQAGISMLAQANQMPQMALSLLR
jgi:flagellin